MQIDNIISRVVIMQKRVKTIKKRSSKTKKADATSTAHPPLRKLLTDFVKADATHLFIFRRGFTKHTHDIIFNIERHIAQTRFNRV